MGNLNIAKKQRSIGERRLKLKAILKIAWHMRCDLHWFSCRIKPSPEIKSALNSIRR